MYKIEIEVTDDGAILIGEETEEMEASEMESPETPKMAGMGMPAAESGMPVAAPGNEVLAGDKTPVKTIEEACAMVEQMLTAKMGESPDTEENAFKIGMSKVTGTKPDLKMKKIPKIGMPMTMDS